MLSDKYEVSEDEGNNGNIPVTIRKHLNALKRYSKELQNKECNVYTRNQTFLLLERSKV